MSRGGAFPYPVYQIDFSAVASGKRVAATKRRIRWRFGFPNRAALEEGRTGTECRGEEHEVTIVWSITSGKRQIIMDGKEIHYSSTRTSIMDHSWSSRGNHVMKVVCHAAPPMTATPGFRQYDFFIDGQSFFTMPKVYELGLRGPVNDHRVPGRVPGGPPGGYGERSPNRPYGGGGPGDGVSIPRTPEEEEAELQRAINASLEESRRHLEQRHQAPDRGIEDERSAVTEPPGVPSGGGGGGGGVVVPAPAPTTSDLLDFGGPLDAPNAQPPPSEGQSLVSYNTTPTQALGGPPPPPPPPPHAQQDGSFGVAPQPPPQQQSYLALPGPAPAAPYGSPPPAAPAPYGAPPGAPVSGYGAPAPSAQVQAPLNAASSTSFGSTGGPPSLTTSFSNPPQGEGTLLSSGSGDGYVGHVPEDPFAPKPPSHHDIASEILSAYGTEGSAASTPQGAYPGGGGFGGSPPQPGQPLALTNGGTNYDAASSPDRAGMTMNGLSDPSEGAPQLTEEEKALRKLVNLDHIDEPPEEKVKLTMKQKEDENAKKQKGKSRGLPPAAKGYVGEQATLNQIKEVKPEKAPKDGVMNAPPPTAFNPAAAAAGAMVIYGSSPGQNGGPPPLQPRGFGVGYNAYGQAAAPPTQQPQYAPQQPQGYPGAAPPQAQQYGQPAAPPYPQQQQQQPQQYPPPLQQPQGYQYR